MTKVTVETEIPRAEIAEFYDLYESAFGPMRTRAATRHVLHREEFEAEMLDPRVLKFVAWDHGNYAVGLTTATNHLEAYPLISADYYHAKFPEEAARDALYYIGFSLVRPEAQRGTALYRMTLEIVRLVAAHSGILCADICSYNNESFRFADGITRFLRNRTAVTVHSLDTQTYYAAQFHSGRAQ